MENKPNSVHFLTLKHDEEGVLCRCSHLNYCRLSLQLLRIKLRWITSFPLSTKRNPETGTDVHQKGLQRDETKFIQEICIFLYKRWKQKVEYTTEHFWWSGMSITRIKNTAWIFKRSLLQKPTWVKRKKRIPHISSPGMLISFLLVKGIPVADFDSHLLAASLVAQVSVTSHYVQLCGTAPVVTYITNSLLGFSSSTRRLCRNNWWVWSYPSLQSFSLRRSGINQNQ